MLYSSPNEKVYCPYFRHYSENLKLFITEVPSGLKDCMFFFFSPNVLEFFTQRILAGITVSDVETILSEKQEQLFQQKQLGSDILAR